MRTIYELHALLEDGGQKKPFYLRIAEPQLSADGEDFYCRVHAPELFDSDKDIFGVDEKQAHELAAKFVKSILDGKPLTDGAGRSIDVKHLVI